MDNNPSHHKSANRPIEMVSWDDAVEFCKRLGAQKDMKYRLPTKAEWAYACRAGTRTTYSFGEEVSQLDQYAWYRANSGNTTHEVGLKLPNPWGLHDMHGNVWEWCQDRHGPQENGDVSDPTGPASGDKRVLNGGAFSDLSRHVTFESSAGQPPAFQHKFAGFRVARTISGVPDKNSSDVISTVDESVTPPATPPKGSPANLNRGLIAYYPFNGNAKDESGNGHDGTVSGATLTSDRYGSAAKAYSFDGVNDKIDATISLTPTRITVSAWFKADSDGIWTTREIVNQSNSRGWSQWNLSWQYVGPEASAPAYNRIFNRLVFTEAETSDHYSGPLEKNIWHHAVTTFDGKKQRLFVSGSLVSTVNRDGGTLTYTHDDFNIGYYTGGPDFFDGSIDDIRIYNRALSAEEVKALYDLERSPKFVIPDKSGQAVSKTKVADIYTLNEDIVGEVELEKKRKPYKLVRSIRVNANAKLTIERGTEILAGPGVTIELIGTIQTFGDSDRLVTIRNAHPAHPWGGLVAGQGFTGAIEGFEIRGADVGVSFGQDAVSLGTIKDCIISYNMTGVRLDRSRERHQISNTIIANNYKNGILVSLGTYKLNHCTIANNGEIGILMAYYGDGKIVDCVLDSNPIAIQSKVYTTHLEMTGCNVIHNRRNIDVGTAEAFRCRGNHWGTTNLDVIASSIFDGYDKLSLGHVDFSEVVKKPFKKAGAQLDIKRR